MGNDAESSDIIRVSGRKENCEEAVAALKALVPINIEVDVPFEFHRFIIGRGGENVRTLMNKHDVNIKVPSSDQQSSVIVVTGPKAYVESAKQALLAKVEELEKEKAEKELKSFEIKLDIKPEYHPKIIDNRVHSMIIGRKGAGIRKIQQDFNVEIKLPREGDPNPDMVIVMGTEDGVLDCKDHLLNIQEEYLQDAID